LIKLSHFREGGFDMNSMIWEISAKLIFVSYAATTRTIVTKVEVSF